MKKYRTHWVLFLLTVITTCGAGALWWEGVDLVSYPWQLWKGWTFAVPLLSILGMHELGHYMLARYYGVPVSLPYFIPAPTFLGTFGAVIRMHALPSNRRALFDVAIAGPIAGMFIAIPVVVWGLLGSSFVEMTTVSATGYMQFGDGLLFQALSWAILGSTPENHILVVNSLCIAGWVGFFVTALNLIPMGQLDGGHILAAALGRYHKLFSKLVCVLLAVMGIFYWQGWMVFAILGLFVGAFRIHPSLGYPASDQLDAKRKLLALVALILFLITFIPVPIQIQ